MLSRDKIEDWLCNEVTIALIADVERAIEDLSYKLVYEQDAHNVRTIQGMIRAYMDILDTIENCELGEE